MNLCCLLWRNWILVRWLFFFFLHLSSLDFFVRFFWIFACWLPFTFFFFSEMEERIHKSNIVERAFRGSRHRPVTSQRRLDPTGDLIRTVDLTHFSPAHQTVSDISSGLRPLRSLGASPWRRQHLALSLHDFTVDEFQGVQRGHNYFPISHTGVRRRAARNKINSIVHNLQNGMHFTGFRCHGFPSHGLHVTLSVEKAGRRRPEEFSGWPSVSRRVQQERAARHHRLVSRETEVRDLKKKSWFTHSHCTLMRTRWFPSVAFGNIRYEPKVRKVLMLELYV